MPCAARTTAHALSLLCASAWHHVRLLGRYSHACLTFAPPNALSCPARPSPAHQRPTHVGSCIASTSTLTCCSFFGSGVSSFFYFAHTHTFSPTLGESEKKNKTLSEDCFPLREVWGGPTIQPVFLGPGPVHHPVMRRRRVVQGPPLIPCALLVCKGVPFHCLAPPPSPPAFSVFPLANAFPSP